MRIPAGLTFTARAAIAAALACTAAGCDPPESVRDELMGRTANFGSGGASSPSSPNSELPKQPAFAWQALAPSKIASKGPPAILELSSGYALVLYPSQAVSPGDVVKFQFRASGRAGKMRSVLIRHCGSGSESDSDSELFDIGEAAADYTLEHVFKESHPCLRVTFQAIGPPNSITVHSWQLLVSAAASASPKPGTPAGASPADPVVSNPSPAN